MMIYHSRTMYILLLVIIILILIGVIRPIDPLHNNKLCCSDNKGYNNSGATLYFDIIINILFIIPVLVQ